MDTIKEKFSYAIGQQIGMGITKDRLDVDPTSLIQGISDALNDEQSKLTVEEMQSAIQHFQEQAAGSQQAISDKNGQTGKDFLAKNSTRDEVTVLDNGLQYRVITQSEGDLPAKTDSVTVHYKGSLISGQEFDSSYSRGTPTTFPVTGVIPGWQEILQIMPLGSKWEVFIPAEMAYGEQGAGSAIGPNETLVFEMELISIN
ncbi:MAG: hypothetical protein DRQ61_03990 [Gammaproteobacteria bacterium]|nr:MAG: hypothetical protein DRQ56_06625 [Gammaproteobacteria bacterium]RLA23403.1 MAG: hypothetical protein DRQ61_03990 [Gammaproteobacteria bacterium]